MAIDESENVGPQVKPGQLLCMHESMFGCGAKVQKHRMAYGVRDANQPANGRGQHRRVQCQMMRTTAALGSYKVHFEFLTVLVLNSDWG
jgi:hypothetical protein